MAGIARRRLMAAPAGLALARPRRAAAQAFAPIRVRIAGLQLGANLERWFAISRDNHPRRLGRAWWRDFRAAGFDHVRMFIPEVGKTGAGMEIPGLFAEAVQDAQAAGLTILLGLADFYYQSNPWQAQDWAALRARADFLAARCDPATVVLAALNEPVFDDTPSWLPVRDRLLGVLRHAAPDHLLMWGGREWCSVGSLLECTPPADPGTMAEVHDYQGGDTAAVTARFAPAAAWRDRHGLPVVVAELGGALGHETDREAFAADLAQSLPALRQLGLPATLWSYSHGGWWRLQSGDEPVPRPGLLPGR
ncbi:glycoside hydrolase family 5 protein [Paeniroseomonas aquatica]|uniref:Cellulase family glycosylhydrolase n=1 Tax=Paeniroseomonas aquatica TaxID=373043 RepID=A0ABT8A6B5_9PROT|nr:cellulase family glycosylhydrolase [Paeniroseomonas aquatica]MDN3565236.1 cellulase family glycosylhydrolase [Paeniroseomonas aquatica]